MGVEDFLSVFVTAPFLCFLIVKNAFYHIDTQLLLNNIFSNSELVL